MTYLSIYPVVLPSETKKIDHFRPLVDCYTRQFIYNLVQMYKAWAKRNGVKLEIVEADIENDKEMNRAVLSLPEITSSQMISESGIHSNLHFTDPTISRALITVSDEIEELDEDYLASLRTKESLSRMEDHVRVYYEELGRIMTHNVYRRNPHPGNEKDICVDYNALENGRIEPFLTSFSVE